MGRTTRNESKSSEKKEKQSLHGSALRHISGEEVFKCEDGSLTECIMEEDDTVNINTH